MSTSAVVSIQDNRVANCPLLAVHSPLVFLIDVTSTTPLDYTLVQIELNGVVHPEWFRTIPYADITATTRRFWFDASQLVRSLLPSVDDNLISENTIEEIGKNVILLRFSDNTTTYTPKWPILFYAQQAAAQFGESPSLYRLYFNDSNYDANDDSNTIAKANIDVYYAAANDYCYVYFYDNEGLVITVDTDFVFTPMLDFDDIEFLDNDDEVLLTL